MATNLLLLDESLLVQRVVELAFRNTRVDIHMAEDADEALEIAGNAPPDIVVASLDMENSDGLDFCRRLREKPGLSRVPLLVLTSTRNSVSDEKIQEVGATGNIEKPFKPVVFTTEVERIIGPLGRAPAPEPQEQTQPHSPEKTMDTEAADEAPPPPEDTVEESKETPPAPAAEEALEETEEATSETEGAESPDEEDEQPPFSAPGLDSEKLEPIIHKYLEEAAEKIAPTLLRRIESIVVAQLPDIVEQIVLREIEKIKRGE